MALVQTQFFQDSREWTFTDWSPLRNVHLFIVVWMFTSQPASPYKERVSLNSDPFVVEVFEMLRHLNSLSISGIWWNSIHSKPSKFKKVSLAS